MTSASSLSSAARLAVLGSFGAVVLAWARSMVAFFESAAVELAGVDADAPVSSPLAPAFAGAVRNIPEAHANACNTASRTSLLLEFMISPWLFFVAFFKPACNYDTQRAETPHSICVERIAAGREIAVRNSQWLCS
jgi:hypothetical protein